jgi:enoyl-CoA hydratase/carnithine racemase
MLLHCDLVYASVNARFQMSFVDLGLVPEAGSTLLLPLLMGHQRAAELLMLAEPFDVSRAKVLGLVNAVYPANELMAQAREKAKELASKPPAAMRMTKQLLKEGREALAPRMQAEARAFERQLQSPEAREAVTALLAKRKPDFSKFS